MSEVIKQVLFHPKPSTDYTLILKGSTIDVNLTLIEDRVTLFISKALG